MPPRETDPLDAVIPFGQYKGRTLRSVLHDEPDAERYLDWLLGTDNLKRPKYAAFASALARACETFNLDALPDRSDDWDWRHDD